MTKKKKRIITAICGVMIVTAVLLAIFIPRLSNSQKSDGYITYKKNAVSGLIFENTNFSVGTPITVSLQNPENKSSDWDFLWTVNGNKISNNSNTYTPTDEDKEKLISVTATCGSENYTAITYVSNLPVVYINTEKSIGDAYVNGDFHLQGNSTYTDSEQFYNGGVSIKLRGNSTRGMDKAPYKIKLEDKADLLGMGASKHWVLLANAIDHTFMRNKLVYDFAADLGASYAAESDNVVLILNGEYQGVYELCEQLRVSKERIDIFNWEGLAEDAADAIGKTEALKKEEIDNLEDALIEDMSWISSPYEFTYKDETYTMTDYVTIPDTTGGFLLEMDFYNLNTGSINSLQTNFSQPFYFNTPANGGTNAALSDYAYDYIQSFEYALHSLDFVYRNSDTHYKGVAGRFNWDNLDKGWSATTSAANFTSNFNDGLHYSQLFDMNSLVNNFLICEFTVNWDSMKNSVFITKDLDGLAELSPAWDFDWAFGNDNMYRIYTNYTDIWQTTDNYFTNEQYYQSVQWNRFLIKDPYFLLQVYNKYKEIRPTIIEDIIKDGGVLDSQYDYLYDSGVANDNRWNYTYTNYDGKNFDLAYNNLQHFVNDRITWLDNQFDSLESLISSLGYYKSSSDLSVTEIIKNGDGTATITAATTNPSAATMSFEVNGINFYDVALVNGQASVTVDASILEDENQNMVQLRIKDSANAYITNSTTSKNADTIYALSNYKVF